MSKHYGIPYMGSKDKIAPQICDYLLSRHYDKKYFIDACCGGLAISNYILERSNKIIIANDLDEHLIGFYKEFFTNENVRKELFEKYCYNWIDRETYKKICSHPTDSEFVLMICVWTFGNNSGKLTYLYGQDIELQKELLHNLLIYGNEEHLTSYFKAHCKERERELNIIREWYKTLPANIKELDYKTYKHKRILFMQSRKSYMKNYVEVEKQRKNSELEHLERVEPIIFKNMDCIELLNTLPPEIITNSIVYIDPPYKDTASYKEGSNDLHEKITKRAIEHKDICPVYVSEYQVYDGLSQCFYELKQQTLTSTKEHRVVKKELLLYNNYPKVNEQLGDLLGLWNN